MVSFSPSVTDALVAIGAGDELVGVSVFCRPYAPPHAEVVGDYLKARLDRLRELAPDLVFTSGAAQERLAASLRAAGFRVVHLPVPASIYGVSELVWRVGVEVGRLHEASEKAAEVSEGLLRLRGAAPPARLLYVIDLGEPVSPGPLSYAGHALLHLGLRSIYEGVRSDWVRVAPADVRRWLPELIVYEGKVENPTLDHALGALRRWMLVDDKLLRRMRVVVVPRDTLAHYGPRIVEHLERLVEALR